MQELIYNFLKNTPPFDRLSDDQLDLLVQETEVKHYQEGEVIYEHNTTPIDHVEIVYQGEVEKFFINKRGEKVSREIFSKGEMYGEMSYFLDQYFAIRQTEALTKSEVFKIPKNIFATLCEQNHDFYEFFTNRFGRRMLDEKYAHHFLKDKTPKENFEPLDDWFQKKARDFRVKIIYHCYADTPIYKVAQEMMQLKSGYMAICDAAGEIIGVITDHDFKTKVVAKQLDTSQAISKIMSKPIVSIGADRPVYEALLLMFKRRVKYLFLEEDDEIIGLVTHTQLLFQQTRSPFLFIQSLQTAGGAPGLKNKWEKVPAIVQQLLDRGVKTESINEVVSSVIDNINYYLVERVLFDLRKIPVNFVFMAMGSEGRKEQTLSTDQDNAIIYEDVHPDKAEELNQYFLKVGSRTCDLLNEVGFTYCKANYMANNPAWCQPLSQWKQYYYDWINNADGDGLLKAILFFDSRAVYGAPELVKELKDYAFELLNKVGNARFYAFLAESTRMNKPPLNFFKGFKLQSKGQDKQKVLNIKDSMKIVVDFARIYAMKHGIYATNTGKRITALQMKGVLNDKEATELFQAYYFMMQLRLRNQITQIHKEEAPNNLLAPASLSQVERVTLKEVFRILKDFQSKMSVEFTGKL